MKYESRHETIALLNEEVDKKADLNYKLEPDPMSLDLIISVKFPSMTTGIKLHKEFIEDNTIEDVADRIIKSVETINIAERRRKQRVGEE